MTPPRASLPVALAASLISLCASAPARAENWPQWRGPRHDGTSSETSLPTEWGKDKNVAWRLPLPGPAGATPVVWGDNVFLTTADGDELVLLCVGTDGKPRWRQVVGQGNQTAREDEGNSASPSPCTDGRHVWSFMGTGDLGCYTVDGEEVWRLDLQDRFGKFDIQFGMSSTPVLHDGLLLLQLIHGSMHDPAAGEQAIVAALNAATGETVWQKPRKTDAVGESRHSYASAVLYDYGGLTLLITHGGDYTVAYDPKTGKEAWRVGSFNGAPGTPEFNPFLRFVASPGVGPGIVVCPTAKRGPIYAIRPDAKGKVSLDGKEILWSLDKGTPDVPTPLIHDGLVYLLGEDGVLRVCDAKTGETYYQERTHRGRHRASPVYADGHVYLTARDDGRVTVVKTGKKLEVVARNDTGEQQAATPVISNGTIYLRTFNALWAIRNK